MSRPAQAILDLPAFAHNLKRVRALATGCKVMAVIKANGYGHGMIRVAKALGDTDAFAVASLDEALLLREAGMQVPIVLLEGFFETKEIPDIVTQGLTVVVHHEEQVRILEASMPSAPLSVWLKIDTGMHRLGIAPEKVAAIYQRLKAMPTVKIIGLMTHLASADERNVPTTVEQLARFESTVAPYSDPKSIANSAGILAWPRSHGDWVRPGLMLYGASPFADRVGQDHDLRPVLSLNSQLIAVNRFKRGERVGYGGEWQCPEDMSVGVAAIGYGDGYPRHARTGTSVLLNQQRVPLIGRVSMDMITLDLRSQPNARSGDAVCLWGPGLPVEEIAHCTGTVPYDLLCRVTSRVRVHVE